MCAQSTQSIQKPTCPLPRNQVVDRYFLEHRAKLIDIAAFLDRVERARDDGASDNRVAALRSALAILLDGQAERTRRVLELFSDLSEDPIPKSPGKGAIGVEPSREY